MPIPGTTLVRRVGCFSRSIQHLILPPTATQPWPRFRSKGHTLVLLKPSTYMNLSGKAVRYWLDAEKIPRENLLVVVDDIALPFGTFRMRTKGSAGGHNGLKNITELLGTEEYSRIRFGIGGDFPRGHQVDYVLGHWNDEERKARPERLKYFGDAILSFAAIGPERTMNLFNKK